MLTHGAWALFAFVGLGVLLARSLWFRDAAHTAAVEIYGASVLSAFVASTLHHTATAPASSGREKRCSSRVVGS